MPHHPDLVPVRRALLSVSDKTGLEAFARALADAGVEIISTGGTARALQAAGVDVTPIDQVTGFPEMMDGRVKTLHPKIHGGLLALREDPAHARAMKDHDIRPIDLVCINLYPFEQTIAKPGVARHEAIENIDIGGPSMVRSAAKNHAYVAVVTDPAQYGPLLAEMQVTEGCTSLQLREQLAAAAFALTARYDQAIAGYLREQFPLPTEQTARSTPPAHAGESPDSGGVSLPTSVELRGVKVADLRYGENPHQPAAVYAEPGYRGPSVVSAEQLHGKALSYNNLNDAAAALELAIALARQCPKGHVAACCIKHANPCGAATAPGDRAAIEAAIAGDPLAAFGGILALSGPLTPAGAARLCEKDLFLEVLLAERFDAEGLAQLRTRWQNLRILAVGPLAGAPEPALQLRAVRGGLLAQGPDSLAPKPQSWQHLAGPAPTPAQLEAAGVLEVVVRAMNSNAITIGGHDPERPGAVRLFGGGLGQVDRLQACRIAASKAGPLARGAIALSDAFFPFPDGPGVLIDAGVGMIVHPGGSKRDQETVDLCNQRGVTCLTTGVRRFKH
jgi:phosphoribosylaminoimidazolecarboxamide formyltransferase/IMP cyclohydrolase